MAFKCKICGKGPASGKNVSHSHLATNRQFYPNLIRKKTVLAGVIQRVYVCTVCLKSNKVPIA